MDSAQFTYQTIILVEVEVNPGGSAHDFGTAGKVALVSGYSFFYYFEGTMDLLIGRPEDGIEVSKQESQYSQ